MSKGQIHIHQVIVHKVDRKVQDHLELADLETPITDEKVAGYLSKRIAENRSHIHARRARFAPAPAEGASFKALCDKLLAAPGEFVDQSQAMAEHLFEQMDKRTSPGDVVFAAYSEGDEEAPRCLALLKMDPGDALRSKREQFKGQQRTLLQHLSGVLPMGELQKCAFILHPDLRPEADHDVIVLDQQLARFGVRRRVSTFFSAKFLQCRLAHEPAHLTNQFYFESFDWIDKQDQWSELQRAVAKGRIDDALYLKEVNAQTIAQEFTEDITEQEAYVGHLRSKELDLAFKPDEKQRDRLQKYRFWVGDNDLKVRILASAVGKGATLHHEPDPNDPQWTRVTIRTRRWVERAK